MLPHLLCLFEMVKLEDIGIHRSFNLMKLFDVLLTRLNDKN